jgi:inorganic pyrophosphatase
MSVAARSFARATARAATLRSHGVHQLSAHVAWGPLVAGFLPHARRFSQFATSIDGEVGTLTYRLRFKDGAGTDISPWHDLPLYTGEDGVLNFLVEIPKNTKPKMEVAIKEAKNPIAQDVKKGKLRDYHGPIFWNYGMLPQTWENPNIIHPETKCAGDNDPVDVVEIGSEALAQGSLEPVKVLGVLAMIDDGELDWKIIAIRTADPMAAELNDIADVEAKCHGVVTGIREWSRWYKTPDGKPLNSFGFDERALSKAHALEVVAETHAAWKDLCQGKIEKGKLWLK